MGVGALAGAFLRYKIVSSPISVSLLPINILIVNMIGSLVLGIFSVISVIWNLDAKYSLLFAVGFCGSFTTMSSFLLESINLLENKQLLLFGINTLANVGLSIGALVLGRSLTALVLWR